VVGGGEPRLAVNSGDASPQSRLEKPIGLFGCLFGGISRADEVGFLREFA
jgi:hypothetical protein